MDSREGGIAFEGSPIHAEPLRASVRIRVGAEVEAGLGRRRGQATGRR